jgi:chemotaxis methyl-accepting protein methylase
MSRLAKTELVSRKLSSYFEKRQVMIFTIKKTTLMRRIERRKGIHQLDSTQDYVRFLQENPNEIQLLFKELLIG